MEMSEGSKDVQLSICGDCRELIFIMNAAFVHRYDRTSQCVASRVGLGTAVKQS